MQCLFSTLISSLYGDPPSDTGIAGNTHPSSHFRRNTNFRGRALNIGSISPDVTGSKRSRLEVGTQLRFRVWLRVVDWKCYFHLFWNIAASCTTMYGAHETKMRLLATPQTQSYQAVPRFSGVTSTSFTCCCGFGGNNTSKKDLYWFPVAWNWPHIHMMQSIFY